MKKLLIPIYFMIGLAAVIFYWWYQNSKPISSPNAPNKNFLVSKGSSAWQIAQSLEKKEFIKSALVFKIYVQFTGLSKKIQAGEYRLSPSFSLYKIVNELVRGPAEIWVTIPEGLRREEIAQKFTVSLEKDTSFADEFLAVSKDEEGFLFPDTYLFPKDASASLIVDKMTRTFDSKMIQFHETLLGSEAVGGLNLKGIITLASLVERETRTDEERPVVAGILLKRIEIGMPLQVDASIQYLVSDRICQGKLVGCSWWPQITTADRNISSVFNTYKNRGLPPSPIANPGLSSIAAVINPVETEYLYYLHDTKGQIHYAKTLEEHNANVKKYLGN